MSQLFSHSYRRIVCHRCNNWRAPCDQEISTYDPYSPKFPSSKESLDILLHKEQIFPPEKILGYIFIANT